jgi:AcrR family transcriptional regulator
MAGPRTKPRKLPRQRRAQETVDAILEATRRVLIQRGYLGATTAQIARLAGVSIGSLYQYFPSKAALVSALSRRHSEAMLALFRQRVDESRALPLRAAVRLIIQTEMEALGADPALHRVLFEHVPRLDAAEHITAVQAQVVDLIRAELTSRAEQLDVDDPELAAFLVVYAIDGVVQAALRHRPELVGSAALLDHCTDLVVQKLDPPVRRAGAANR